MSNLQQTLAIALASTLPQLGQLEIAALQMSGYKNISDKILAYRQNPQAPNASALLSELSKDVLGIVAHANPQTMSMITAIPAIKPYAAQLEQFRNNAQAAPQKQQPMLDVSIPNGDMSKMELSYGGQKVSVNNLEITIDQGQSIARATMLVEYSKLAIKGGISDEYLELNLTLPDGSKHNLSMLEAKDIFYRVLPELRKAKEAAALAAFQAQENISIAEPSVSQQGVSLETES